MWFHAPGARSIRLRFPKWPPPHGAEVILYNADKPRESIGPIGDDYVTQADFFWSPIIFGETVKLEYYLPPYVDRGDPATWLAVDALPPLPAM